MKTLPPFVDILLKEIAASEGFTEDAQIDQKSGSNSVDGFMGDILRIVISGARKINERNLAKDELYLVCKLIPADSRQLDGFKANLVFERETLTYTKIFPQFAEFQRAKGLSGSDCFQCYPKCYAAVANADKCEYAIIMEDLRPKGFVMWPKTLPAPVDHLNRVVEELAKLHAISFALKDQQPDVYNELRQVNDLFRFTLRGNGVANWLKLAYDKAIAVLSDENHKKIAQDLRNNLYRMVDDHLGDGASDPFGVISHGDCWILNQLFRYNNEVDFVYFHLWC